MSEETCKLAPLESSTAQPRGDKDLSFIDRCIAKHASARTCDVVSSPNLLLCESAQV